MAKNFAWLTSRFHPRVLIDIGANDGAYGSALQKLFGAEVVHAFEPLEQHQDDLLSRGFVVHRVALADRSGEACFHVNDYSAASSILPATDFCRREYPQTSNSRMTSVRLARLDDELPEAPGDSLVKIDAQGYELPIILGGEKVLSAARLILIEMTFEPLYEGQALFNEVHAALDRLGFEMSGFQTQYSEQATERPLFAHCVYIRRN